MGRVGCSSANRLPNEARLLKPSIAKSNRGAIRKGSTSGTIGLRPHGYACKACDRGDEEPKTNLGVGWPAPCLVACCCPASPRVYQSLRRSRRGSRRNSGSRSWLQTSCRDFAPASVKAYGGRRMPAQYRTSKAESAWLRHVPTGRGNSVTTRLEPRPGSNIVVSNQVKGYGAERVVAKKVCLPSALESCAWERSRKQAST